MKSKFQSLMLAGALALPLAACETETNREVDTAQGTRIEREQTTVGVDDNLETEARETGQDLSQAGRELGQDAKQAGRELMQEGREAGRELKQGAQELEQQVPDVDVDVSAQQREPAEGDGGTRR